VDAPGALEARERYFHVYGATVVGLQLHHGVDARDFLGYVHDVDYGVLTPDPDLVALMGALPGRRIVFTNGGGGHAERVIDCLGLSRVVDAVFDIEDAQFAPKPQLLSYERLIAACHIEPARAILIEDTLRNLEPAHDLGFSTALVGSVHPEPRPSYVHHWAHDVKGLLRDMAEK